ncbi:D-2-hydroxyacid dehydrogenase [Metabacillus arenae]|uniref:D-2-hydroxyacid dehydrogenase n=1 Tax=Metabacillus arenae TaxID=2771434 RepID=A0A926NGM7_9BACI|nr:D-2-hydroxyacid dehydrogenase [Metabacillus arenae]MBD1379673.1 D-2-hydroxyacid dehydrogenase [Metabacillus arenae]
MKILSTVRLPDHDKERLSKKYPQCTFVFDQKINKAVEYLKEAEILLTYGEDLNEEHVYSASDLKWIMVASAGLEKMPFSALQEKNVLVTNARGIHKIPMAEYTLAMMLQVSRQAKVLSKNEAEQNWTRKVEMVELFGKTIVVLGAGAIGSEIARLCKAFNMRTIGINTTENDVPHFDQIVKIDKLDNVVGDGDFVVSALPSTRQTQGILGIDQFKFMKREAVLINIGRGDAIIEKDLIKALSENLLKHAVLDVFIKEPLHMEHPFWTMDNVTVTPHLSGISKMYLPRALEIFEDNLNMYLSGKLNEMRNPIQLEKGY